MADNGTVVDDQTDGDGGVAAAIQQGIQAASQATATPMLQLGGAEALASRGVPAFSQQAQPIQTVPTSLSSTDPNAPIMSNVQPWNMADANLQPHMSRLHRVLDTVANIMGGGGQQTYHVTTDDQGNVSGISKTPATTGEKWGRIAAAALSGAAAGASQVGIGAGARAIGAGFQAGEQVARAPLERAREEAAQQQQLMLRNAQMARIHQQIAEAQFNDKLAPIKEARLEAQEQLNFRNAVEDDGGTDYGTYSNEQEMRDMAQAHPELMNWHTGQGGQILKIPQSDGKTHVYGLPADAGGTRLTEPRAYPKLVTADAKGNITTSDETETAPRGTKTTEYWNHVQARIAQNLQAENTASQIRQRDASPGGRPAAPQVWYDPKTGQPMWVAPPAGMAPGTSQPANFNLTRKAPDAEPTVGDDSLQGEDYLQSLPAPMRAQVQAIARGDAPLPPMGRNPANRVIRDAVFNYDPTYRTQRYDTMQNFRTKGDSTALTQMSTALEHADNALQNSQKVGGTWLNPSLGLGTRAQTDDEAAYQKDADFLVGETGRLVTGGVIGVQEGDKLTSGLMSSRQSVRDSAIHEILRLTKGKVDALYEKFRRGAGMDLPTEEFLGPDSIARLNKYQMALPTQNAVQVGGNTPTVRSTPGVPATQTPAPSGTVTVQIPGSPPGHIPRANLDQFKRDHPNATIGP